MKFSEKGAGGGGQRPFGNFPEIHPFLKLRASLPRNTNSECIKHTFSFREHKFKLYPCQNLHYIIHKAPKKVFDRNILCTTSLQVI